MRIKTQISAVALVAVIAAGATGAIAVLSHHKVNDFLDDHSQVHPVIEDVVTLSNLTSGYLNRPTERGVRQWRTVYSRLVNERVPMVPAGNPAEREMVANLVQSLKAVEKDFEEARARIATVEEMDAAAGSTPSPGPDAYIKRLKGRIDQRLTNVVTAAFDASHDSLTDLRRETDAAATLILAVATIAIIVALVVSIAVARRITGRLQEAMATVATAASEMAVTAEEQHRISAQQATSVNQTTTTMEELATSSRHASEQAGSVGNTVEQLMSHVTDGRTQADAMVEEITRLGEQVEGIAEQIRLVSEQSNQIDTVTVEVTDIASQTNLLALNAAVEAVRAGEHGRGFAVVAQEIRKLADQSKASAWRIRGLVADAQKVNDNAVAAADGGLETLQRTVGAVRGSSDLFKELLASFEGISKHVEQIALSARQQAAATQEVVTAMDNLSAGAKEAEAGLNQTSVGVEQLKDVAARAQAML